MDQPYISVIVTAYNRRRYLPFALRSLEAQTLPKDRFEVIVVKNFEDKESDNITSRNGWKEVYNDDLYQGRMVLAGLEESRGEVITFLDDDDMYVNNRLEEVYKAFTAYNRLTYFHNSQTIIDDNGDVLERPPRSKNLVGGSPIVIDVDKLQMLAKKYVMSTVDITLKVRAGADVNGSSMAVRRPVLESHVQLLKRLPIGIDNFAFVSSLRAGGLMYFTDERLTLLRVHGENWTYYAWSYYAHSAKGEINEMYLRRVSARLQSINACRLVCSSLLDDDVNQYLCFERLSKGALLLLLQPELGTLPPELRLGLSDIKLALRCYKVEDISLANAALVVVLAFLSPLLASPRGRLVIGKIVKGVVEALTTKRALRRGSLV
ncbi:MAG: glycosyltransferase [Acidianus sp.]|nr:glycosyltransferase [Acidianus sp.]